MEFDFKTWANNEKLFKLDGIYLLLELLNENQCFIDINVERYTIYLELIETFLLNHQLDACEKGISSPEIIKFIDLDSQYLYNQMCLDSSSIGKTKLAEAIK